MIKLIFAALGGLLVWLIVSSHLIIQGSKIFVIIGVCLGVGLMIGYFARGHKRD